MKTRRRLFCIQIANKQYRSKLSVAAIRRITETLLVKLKKPVELHLVFVNDAQIRKINRLFHNSDRPTDVLSFSKPAHWPRGLSALPFLGEIVISIDRTIAHAKQFQIEPSEELIRYVIHGVLHLLGERDGKPKERQKMIKRQEALLDVLRPIPKLIR